MEKLKVMLTVLAQPAWPRYTRLAAGGRTEMRADVGAQLGQALDIRTHIGEPRTGTGGFVGDRCLMKPVTKAHCDIRMSQWRPQRDRPGRQGGLVQYEKLHEEWHEQREAPQA